MMRAAAKSGGRVQLILTRLLPGSTFGFASLGAVASYRKLWAASAAFPAASVQPPLTEALGPSGPL